VRIAVLLAAVPAPSGPDRVLADVARWLAARHDVTLLGLRPGAGPSRAVDGVDVRVLVPGTGREPAAPSRLAPRDWAVDLDSSTDAALEAALVDLRADVLVTASDVLAGVALALVPRGTRVVLYAAAAPQGVGVGPLDVHGPRLSAVVATSPVVRGAVVARLGAVAPQVDVVPPVLPDRPLPRSGRINPLVVAVAGRTPDDGTSDVIASFAEVRRVHPDWRLRVVGGSASREAWQRLVWRHRLDGAVDLLGDLGDVAAEVAKSSVVVAAADGGGDLVTALAAGVPVVVRESVAVPDAPSIVVPDGSRGGVAAGVLALVGDRALADGLVSDGLRAVATYTVDTAGPRWLEILEGAVAGRARSGTPAPAAPAPAWAARGPVKAIEDALVAAVRVACARAGVRASVVEREPGPGRVVAVDDGGQAVVLGALATVPGVPELAVSGTLRGDPVLVAPWSPGEGPAPAVLAHADTITAHRAGRVGGSATAELVVQAWRADGDLVRSPGPNRRAQLVGTEAWQRWASDADAAHVEPAYPLWDEVKFPVDAVFMWVDGTEPRLAAERAEYLSRTGRDPHDDGVRAARFASRDDLYYSLAAVQRNLPWVRRTFLVTDRQRPEWLDRLFPDVTVVDHRAIFPDPSALPVFNSHAIEACLHRVPGLAEHFLCLNDDVMVVRPLPASRFFTSTGVAKFFPSTVKIGYATPDDQPHMQAGERNRELIRHEHGVEIVEALQHTPHAHRRDVLLELDRRFADDLARTRASRFRTGTDISLLSSLTQYVGYLSDRYQPGEIAYRFFPVRSLFSAAAVEAVLTDEELDVLCLGEPGPTERVRPGTEERLTEFLADLLDLPTLGEALSRRPIS
jgi:glycosyltransferase involved in cell wall biosynthesis